MVPFLVERELGYAILIGTLLDIVYSNRDSFSATWMDALFSRETHAGEVWVSTTRSPEFGHLLRSPTTGYRCLGTYKEVQHKKGFPGDTYNKDEVLAFDSSAPNASEFLRQLPATIGAETEHHFFLIFETPILPFRHSPGSRISPNIFDLRPTEPMPGSSLERSSDANRLSEASGSAQHNPSEPVQELTPQQMNVDSQMVSVHSSQSDQTLELNEADFTPNLSIPEACLLAGIPSKTLENARFLPATRTTPCFQVFMNFKHLQTILRTFELAEPRSSRTFAGGFRITLGGILQHLDWNIFSYRKKYTAFLWGEKVCRATWKGPVPAKGDPEHILYTRWRGIVWYFRDGGGLDSEVPPRAENKNRRGVDPDESAAAQLRQVMLFGERGVLDDFLAFY